MKHNTLKNRLTAAVLTTCLVVGNIGAYPLAAYAAEEDTASEVSLEAIEAEASSEANASESRDIDAEVAHLLSAGEYEEGSAIVLYDKASPVTDSEELVGTSSLLANAEVITDVSAESYVEATGDTLELPDEELVGASIEDVNADRIGMVFVEDASKSTEELLRELLADPRVLTAEPDYIMTAADMNEEELETAAEDVLGTNLLEDASYETDDIYKDNSDAADEASGVLSQNVTVENPDAASKTSEEADEAPSEASANSTEVSDENIKTEESNETDLAIVDESTASAAASDAALLPETEVQAPAETTVGITHDLTPYQWGMSDGTNRYRYNGVADQDVYGMEIPNWNTIGATNAEGVVVVLDTGVDYTHPDLTENMYRFSSEAQEALDCGEYGICTLPDARDAKDPADDDGHGTHCAGIIGAAWNGVGVSGVASGVKIMAVKVMDDSGRMSYSSAVKGFAFVKKAKKYGIDVRATSNSYGYTAENYALRVLVSELGDLGVVNIFASGNDSRHVDAASAITNIMWDLPNVVIVNASDERGEPASFTNFSVNATHVFAPGVNILSTSPTVDTKETSRTYFSEMDPAPVYSDPYWNNLSDALFGGMSADWMTENYMDYFSYSKVNDQSANGNTPAVRIQVNKDLPEDTSFTICLQIPVDKDAEISSGTLGFYIPQYDNEGNKINQNFNVSMYFIGTDSKGKQVTKQKYDEGAKINWITRSITGLETLNVIGENDKQPCVDMYVSFVPDDGYQIKAGDYIYIDNPCLGSTSYNTGSTAYTFMDGTSMATPAVAGEAMVLYKGRTVNRESANQVVADIKASVRKKDSLSKCTSGGAVNLSVPSNQKAPVINTADLNNTEGTITLGGYYFGSLGDACEVTLAGRALTIKSWEDKSIIVDCPESMASGLQKICVTNASGLTSTGAFSITVPKTSTIEDTSTPLYEKTLAELPADFLGAGEKLTDCAGLDDYIYFTVAEENGYTFYNKRLIRYSIKNDKWEKVVDVPFNGLTDSTMASNKGCIFLCGTDSEDYNHLVRYVPATGKWIESSKCHLCGTRLVNYNGWLLSVGGYDSGYDNEILYIDVLEDAMYTVGNLPKRIGMPQAAYADNTLYIYGGQEYNQTKKEYGTTTGELYCYDYIQKDRVYKRAASKETDLSKYTAKSYEKLYGTICESDTNVYLVGAYMAGDGSAEQTDPSGYSVADGDTWVLGGAPENLNKRLSHTITYGSLATVYKGILYGIGVNSMDENPTSYVFRATEVDDDPNVPSQDTIKVAVPKAVRGLTYNGKAQIGVPASKEKYYTIKNNKKTKAGTYKATLTLTDPEYYMWEDGTRGNKTVTWSIEPVHAKSVKLNKTDLTLYTGQMDQLKATVSLSNAYNKKVTWKSANSKIVTVDKKGKVTAKAAGTVKVTVTTVDGKKTDVCTVKVLKDIPVYRLYDKKGTGDHLFTISESEKNTLMLRGWKYEGIAWEAPVKSSVPVYRFYNKNNGLHMYSSNAGEKEALVKAGWKLEGIAFYAATSGSTRPIYRLYNPNGGQHFFTASTSERNYVKKAGWNAEGAAFQMTK